MQQNNAEVEAPSEAARAGVRLRPEPQRTQPIRNFNGVFRGDQAPFATESAGGDAGPDATQEAADDSDSARQGVASGYRVIDEFLRQGRRAARDFWSPAPTSTDDPGGGAPSEGAPSEPDISRLGQRWLRSLGEFGTNWLELMQAMSRQAPTAPASDETSAGPFGVGGQPSRAADDGARRGESIATVTQALPHLAISVASARPVEVDVSLNPDTQIGDLQVGPLTDLSGELPAIRGVSVQLAHDSAGHEPKLTIVAVVDPQQPSGTYHGVIVASGRSRTVGTVTLRLR